MIGIHTAAVNFHHGIAYTLKKITVMRHHDQCMCIADQIGFQPFDHLIIQMVGRLIQNQQDVYKRQVLYVSGALFDDYKTNYIR